MDELVGSAVYKTALPFVAGYLTTMSPPFRMVRPELGSMAGCGETGVYWMVMPKESVDDLGGLLLSKKLMVKLTDCAANTQPP